MDRRVTGHVIDALGASTVGAREDVYAALDLGTNNCRLLIARPAEGANLPSDADSLRVLDAFSRIVRLGEGLVHSGRLCDAAMTRALDALDVCRDKMDRRRVTRARLIATEACRAAANGAEFIRRVEKRTGLQLEIVDRKTEAHFGGNRLRFARRSDGGRHRAVRYRRRLDRTGLADARQGLRQAFHEGRRVGVGGRWVW